MRALARRPDGAAAWPAFEKALKDASLIVVPALVLAEVDYFLRNNRPAVRALVADILDPTSRYRLEHILPQDLERALALDLKFASLGLGLVDGMVAAIAERLSIDRVLTTDRRDFGAVSIGSSYRRRLVLIPDMADG